jgi:hypothetical protein
MSVSPGDTYKSRTGALYTVQSVRPDGGFIARRDSSGKCVTVSGRMIGRTRTAALNGATFAYQRNATQGGISYTVAIEAGVVYALRDLLTRDDARRLYIPR